MRWRRTTPLTKEHFLAAAKEETDHLAWTQTRLDELGARASLLNPLWYAGAFGLGLLAGKLGDAVSYGFVAETEAQVEAHLASHLSSHLAGYPLATMFLALSSPKWKRTKPAWPRSTSTRRNGVAFTRQSADGRCRQSDDDNGASDLSGILHAVIPLAE